MATASDKSKITRISAKDIEPAEKPTPSGKAVKAPRVKKAGVLRRIGGYFKGSWQELTMVRWPSRKTTWKMTGALILFTVFFAVVILLLDYVFQMLFKLLIGK